MSVTSFSRAVAALVTAFLVASGLLVAGTSGSAVAAPDAPTGLHDDGDPIPTLMWDPVAGATRYQVQGSENIDFSGTKVFDISTVNTAYVPVRVLKEGTLYWRVQAVDGSGSGPFASAEATIDTHTAPTGLTITPGSGASILPPVSPPVVTWDAVPGAIGYDLELDSDNDGVGGTVTSNLKTTTYVIPEPQGVGETTGVADFYVRVRAKFANGLQTEWSTSQQYDVTQLAAVTSTTCAAGLICAPSPTTGVRSSVTVQDVVFDWDPVPGAKQYEIWVALNEDFTNQVEKVKVYSTRYSPKSTYDNNNYFWKVRPINAANQPAPWPATPSEFQRRWPDRPTLVWPEYDATVGDDFYFQWTPVPHAATYQLELSTDPNFSAPLTSICKTSQTTYTAGYKGNDPCMPTPGTTYYWRVRAFDDPTQVEGIYSDGNPATPGTTEPGQFVYDTGVVQRQSPANGATVSVPTLRWAPGRDVQDYVVRVFRADGQQVDSVTTKALSWTPDAELDPADGPFGWTVTAKDADSRSWPTAGQWHFTLTAPPTTGSSPTPLPGVAEPVTFRFPQLSWQPVTGAAYYKLRVSETPGFVLPESATPVLATELYSSSVTDWGSYFLRPGTYTWWVQAYTSTNALLSTGSTSTFTISPTAAVTGQRLALDGRALDLGTACTASLLSATPAQCEGVPATPVLDWAPVTGAGGYLVYLAEDADFTNRLTTPFAVTLNSRWTPTVSELEALADNQSGPAYYWFVRPCAAPLTQTACGPDPVSETDAATNAFRKVSPAVVQTAPGASTPIESGTEVTFRWDDYATTNAGVSYLGGAAPSHQTAERYRLQVAQSATITDDNVIDDVIVDQTTYTAYDRTYPEGDLWWRVQAIDGKGNRLAWSDTRKFVKSSPALDLTDPATYPQPGQHVTGAFPFKWKGQPFDVTWAIEVYKDDDTTLSPAKRVVSATSKQAAYVAATALPPSDLAYRWRIMRSDGTGVGNRGRWSELGRFFVDKAQVNLQSPGDGNEQTPTGVVLDWQPFGAGGVSATKYSVDIRNAGGTSVGSVSSTAATAWAPTVAFAGGTYTWTVSAYDASNNVVGTSPTWTFVVDTALTATVGTQIQAPTGAEVGATLTSTDPSWNKPGVTNSYQWLRNGAIISGATGPTYVTTTADVDKAVALRVTGKLAGYVDGTSFSSAIPISLASAPQATALPTISGVAAARETLTASNGTWPSGSNTKFSYQWFVNGLAVAKETKSTYVVRTRDAGLPVYVRVTATMDGRQPGTAQSEAMTVAKLKSELSVTVAKSKITQRQRGVLTVKISLVDLGVTLGQLQVKDGTKVIATHTLQSGKDTATIRLKKLKKGKHKLTVSYLGSVSTLPSSAKPVVIKVIKAKKK